MERGLTEKTPFDLGHPPGRETFIDRQLGKYFQEIRFELKPEAKQAFERDLDSY